MALLICSVAPRTELLYQIHHIHSFFFSSASSVKPWTPMVNKKGENLALVDLTSQ